MNAPFAGKQGEAAFARLCDELRPDLYRFAFWLARDRQVADDVVQEALLRAWRSRGSLAETAAVKPWLLTIIRREHARLFERKRFKTVQVDELVGSESPELAAEEEQETMDVRRAIFALEDDLLKKANQAEGASDDLEAKFEALGSDATFDRVDASIKSTSDSPISRAARTGSYNVAAVWGCMATIVSSRPW